MASQAASQPSQRPANGSASILVVDADEGFATLLQESLERDQHRVTVATSDIQAIRALVMQRFDLAVVDLGLGDLGGAALARTLRRLQPGLRLVVVPLVGEDIPPELADLHVQGVLPKPFFQPDLADRIAAALAAPMPERPAPLSTRTRPEGGNGADGRPRAGPGRAGGDGWRPELGASAPASPAPATRLARSLTAVAPPSAGGDGFGGEAANAAAAEASALHEEAEGEAAPAAPTATSGRGLESPNVVASPPGSSAGDEVAAAPAPTPAPTLARMAHPAEDVQRTLMREMAALAREIGGAILLVPRELLPVAGGKERPEGARGTDGGAHGPIVWREQLRFEGDNGEGGVYYTLTAAGSDVVLSAMVAPGCPLGLLRERGRQMLTMLLTRR